jgi:predicted nucleic acid binding AN1-type Zn finger protein
MSEFDTALATYKQAKSKLEEARMALQPLVTEVNEAYTKLCGVCTHPFCAKHTRMCQVSSSLPLLFAMPWYDAL